MAAGGSARTTRGLPCRPRRRHSPHTRQVAHVLVRPPPRPPTRPTRHAPPQWGYMATSDAGNTVSFNLLHDVFRGELSDGGCVYNLGRSPGTVIDNNVCHTSASYAYGERRGSGIWGGPRPVGRAARQVCHAPPHARTGAAPDT